MNILTKSVVTRIDYPANQGLGAGPTRPTFSANQDPYARGSYSTFQIGTQLGDRGLLREPVSNNKVLFAGEATMDTNFAQVPGAYASGIREADRIAKLYNP